MRAEAKKTRGSSTVWMPRSSEACVEEGDNMFSEYAGSAGVRASRTAPATATQRMAGMLGMIRIGWFGGEVT